MDSARFALAENVNISTAAAPDVLAAALLCVLPGYCPQVAIRGPAAVPAIPDAVRTLFPAAR